MFFILTDSSRVRAGVSHWVIPKNIRSLSLSVDFCLFHPFSVSLQNIPKTIEKTDLSCYQTVHIELLEIRENGNQLGLSLYL